MHQQFGKKNVLKLSPFNKKKHFFEMHWKKCNRLEMSEKLEVQSREPHKVINEINEYKKPESQFST